MRNQNPSPRESEILEMICLGLTSKEIGSRLYISSGTVETHKRSLIVKLDARNAVDLAVKAITRGYVQYESTGTETID